MAPGGRRNKVENSGMPDLKEIIDECRPCSFCGTAGEKRDYLFVNEARNFIICDICVSTLWLKLNDIRMLEMVQLRSRYN